MCVCVTPANSSHDGHEVSRKISEVTGGCCDCGDAEAWLAEDCCDKHRPLSSGIEDL